MQFPEPMMRIVDMLTVIFVTKSPLLQDPSSSQQSTPSHPSALAPVEGNVDSDLAADTIDLFESISATPGLAGTEEQ